MISTLHERSEKSDWAHSNSDSPKRSGSLSGFEFVSASQARQNGYPAAPKHSDPARIGMKLRRLTLWTFNFAFTHQTNPPGMNSILLVIRFLYG